MPNIREYDLEGVTDEYENYLEMQAEYQAELDLEDYLIEAWEALQPAAQRDEESEEPF